jgi:hypothetical protein
VFGLQLSGAVARTPRFRFRLGASVSPVDRQTTGMDEEQRRSLTELLLDDCGPGMAADLPVRASSSSF